MELNTARVSAVYATLPPCLKFTVIDAKLLSEVNNKSLLTSSVFPSVNVNTDDAQGVISRPLRDVAVAAPRVGVVNVGLVRVLFVSVCVSDTFTISFCRDPSLVLQ